MTDEKIISFKISAEMKEALRVEAFHRATTVSALIRQMIEDGLTESLNKRKSVNGKIDN